VRDFPMVTQVVAVQEVFTNGEEYDPTDRAFAEHL